MGKRRKGCGRRVQENRPSALGSDDEALYKDEQPDPESAEYVFDEIDAFHDRREKIMLERGSSWQRKQQDSSEEEEVLPLDVDSDDVDDDDDEPIDMTSDIEDENDGLPNEKAWGKKKSMYYSTDYVDEDFGGFEGSDAELAEEEEKDAMVLQQKLTQHLDDADFALDMFKLPSKTVGVEVADVGEKVEKDFTKLSSREKLELLQKESPELLGIIEDFKKKMSEIRDRLGILKGLVDDNKIPPGPGADYITTKFHLILNYCINISFYMMLKAQRAPVQHHPVIKRMVNYRNLLNQLEVVDQRLDPEIDSILKNFAETGDIKVAPPKLVSNETAKTKKMRKKFKEVKFATEAETSAVGTEDVTSVKVSRKLKRKLLETQDEQEALALYQMMKQGRRNTKENSDEESIDLPSEEDGAKNIRTVETHEAQEKRSITYQIAKNKGLTPHRKKEQRNPRVKHRMKFRKAKIRRKGHYREPRKEMSRYGGELSGIKAGVRKSIKLG